ncbi:MAG: hypothetical protein VX527_10165 [Planctomycetota bacterium]|nr:hypothetical protein [Planctomycetota bacterium]
MDKTRDKAKQLIEAARREGVDGSPGTRLGQSILFTANAAVAMHVSLLGGNPGANSNGRDRQL